MVIRFNILQSHYRSTLDFSNESLQASEKALKRLWEAYEALKSLPAPTVTEAGDAALDQKIRQAIAECADFMNDDLNTAKVLANLFDLAPVINSMKGGIIAAEAISAETLGLLKNAFTVYLEDIMGLQALQQANDEKLGAVMELVIRMMHHYYTGLFIHQG